MFYGRWLTRFISRRAFVNAISRGVTSMVVTSTSIDATSAPLDQEVPGKAGQVEFQNDARSTGWLSFDMPDRRHILLSAAANGVPIQLMLDSGAGALVLSQSLAKTLGLSPRDNITAIGVTGRADGYTVENVRISIGNMQIHVPHAMVFDLSPIEAAVGHSVTAVLGRDLFDQAVVDIDFASRQIAFRHPGPLTKPAGATELPLAVGLLGRRHVQVSIEGRSPILAFFDLGNDRPISLSPAFAAAHGVLKGKKTSTTMSAWVNGTEISTAATLKEIRIGSTVLRDLPVEIPGHWEQDVPANLGFPIWQRFRLIVDFPENRLFVTPNVTALEQPFRKDRSGMAAKRTGDQLEIVYIAPGSPADLAGLHAGDLIVEINGRRLDSNYFKDNPREGTKPAGTQLQLLLARGVSITLTLADYF